MYISPNFWIVYIFINTIIIHLKKEDREIVVCIEEGGFLSGLWEDRSESRIQTEACCVERI